MSQNKFIGTGVALVTPFQRDGNIDFNALTNLTEHLIQNGVNYLVVMGTTGEAATLNASEKQAVVSHIVQVNAGRLPIVLGMADNNTQALLDEVRSFDFTGIDAILSATPAYNKPNQRGLYAHYKQLAQASPLPIILYNVPGRTAVNMTAETTVQLARDFSNIIATKEASGDLRQCIYIAKNKPDNFLLISGDDNLSIPIISIGGQGTISVVGNAFPHEFSTMIQHALAGNYQEASAIQYKIIELVDTLFEDGNPAGIKAVLHQLQLIENKLRLPLLEVSPTTYAKLEKCVAALRVGKHA
ncbi:MAG: hypothetical protein RIS47_1637 [Bacteroidota bacterium]|jgi:4-hydroxy-tetrahydrodipicolinate synthase